ncbi:MAG: hypothetical protein SV422_05430 [Pseudomonadota bacterium]|nr:hypothetical protein [Pseudomonadota bacterium]
MKVQLAALALLLGSSTVLATDVKFVNADGSALSSLCIAAAESGKTVSTLAAELRIDAPSHEVRCNEKPIHAFVGQFRAEAAAATAYVLSKANSSPETQLCVAAVHSQEEFAALRNTHFAGIDVDRAITCNGQSLNQFVRRYQNRLAALPGAKTASL